MGIRGLFSIISGNPNAYEIVDLIKMAKARNGIEILVDFNSFIRDLIEIISRKIAKDSDNEYLLFLSGEYDIFSEAFAEFHKIFTEMNIKLVWIVDGPKGVDEIASAQKRETWIKRDEQDISKLNQVMDGCNTKLPPTDLNNLGPLYIFEVAINSFKKSGAEIIQLLQGESDDFIASEFHKRKSFAIMTGDTDFLIFKDCKVLFPRLMIQYHKGCLKLPFIDNENPGAIFKKPNVFDCPIVSQENIFNVLKLLNHNELISTVIIKGNDITEKFAQNLQYYLGITKNPEKNARINYIADYISRNRNKQENIYQLPGMDKFLKEFPDFKESIQFCFDFYTLKHCDENKNNSLITFDPNFATDTLKDFFRKKLSINKISTKVYSIHCGVFYDTIIMEKPKTSYPSNSSILQTIRSKIYPYVLDLNLNKVHEWRFRDSSTKFEINVEHANFKTNEIKGKPDSENDRGDLIIYGIDIFEEIWSLLEGGGSLKFFEKFGLEKGFLCYILRYFYAITKNKNINVETNEFKSLFITVFYQYAISQRIQLQTKLKREIFLGMKICPTEKCLIIYSWFMNIYYTGKYLCGGALNIMEDFPNPEQLISASVLFAFYENAMNETNRRLSHLDETTQRSIEEIAHEVFESFSKEYISVTNDLFEY